MYVVVKVRIENELGALILPVMLSSNWGRIVERNFDPERERDCLFFGCYQAIYFYTFCFSWESKKTTPETAFRMDTGNNMVAEIAWSTLILKQLTGIIVGHDF